MKRQTMKTHSLLKQQGMQLYSYLWSHFHQILITRFFAIPSSFRVHFRDIFGIIRNMSEIMSRYWFSINKKTVSVDLLVYFSVPYTLNSVSVCGFTSYNNRLIHAKNVRLQWHVAVYSHTLFTWSIFFVHLSRVSSDVTANKTLK